MSLQAAFRKRLFKHKDKEGKTTHHYHTSASGRPELHEHPSQDPAHQHRSFRPGVTQPRSMRGQKFTPAYGYASKEGQGGRSKQGRNFKKIPADNPYAGGHRNAEAAVMKAVREIAKHKDKRGSTAHHGRGGRQQLSVPERHQLRIARETLRMRPEMVAVAGGPDVEESKKIIQRLTGGK